jgi:CRP/FNR family cyclic AMP-dependent transcriptional regulator
VASAATNGTVLTMAPRTHRVSQDTAEAIASTLRENDTTAALVGEFSHEELTALVLTGSRVALHRNDIVFSEEEVASALYIVVEGRIGIATHRFDDREAILALMEPGDVFGEMSLLDGLPRAATARALEASSCIAVPYEPVRVLFKEHPGALAAVVRMLAARLRVADEQIADAAFLDVTGRTAKRLLEISRGREEFSLPVTQEELAAMVGASRERVNKAIAAFSRLSWLEVTDRRYRIMNREALEIRSR